MDPAARLAESLHEEPIVFAYLFGSHARGTAGELSDVDLAVLPSEEVRDGDRLLLAGRLSLLASEAFGTDTADVLLLDEAPAALANQAIGGRLLLDRDPERRWVEEARIMSRYLDRKWYDERWARWTLERYTQGEFA